MCSSKCGHAFVRVGFAWLWAVALSLACGAAGATTWTFLASEYQNFTVSGTQLVRYGANSSWIEKTVSGTNPCTNAFFGRDPLYGVVKACYLGSDTTTEVWVRVAGENQTFSVTGTQTIRYGANTSWVQK